MPSRLAAVVQIGRGETFHALTGDGRTQPVADDHLLDLHLGAVGEGGRLIDADALPVGPVGHVLGGRVMVQIALHVAVDQRLEAHLQRILTQGRQRTGLIALGFREKALARQVRTRGDLQFGVDGHDLQAGFEGALDDDRSVEHITTALDDQIGIVDQLVQRIGKDVRQREVGHRRKWSAREDTGNLHVLIVLFDQPDEAVGDHSGSGYTDSFDF